MQIYSMKFQNASSVGPWRFMRKQYGVRLGLWDSKPILFWFYLLIYLFLSIYISIIHLTKKVAYGGRISIYSPDHGLVSPAHPPRPTIPLYSYHQIFSKKIIRVMTRGVPLISSNFPQKNYKCHE
jgi:hypothetical protein